MAGLGLPLLFPILAVHQVCFIVTVTGQCVDVVRDCGAKPDDHTDSTQAFSACLHLASKKQGCIVVPPGPYRLTQVVLNVSNIEIRVSNEAVLRPWQFGGNASNGALFLFGSDPPITGEYVENVSLHGEAPGMFTVDVSTVLTQQPWKAQAAALYGGIRRFLIANMHCWMANPVRNPHAVNFSDKPCISSNYANFSGVRLNPQDGVIHNISCKDCTAGYGIVQLRSGERIDFQNMYTDGGMTFRLETGDGIGGYAGEITARNITCKDGFGAFVSSPHIQKNGAFHIKDVSSLGCHAAVIIQTGFSQYGYPPGYFSNSSTITNVLGVYGTHAQNSSTNVDVPSCGVCVGTVYGPVEPITEYQITVTNITAIGFPKPSNRTACFYVNRHHGGCPYGPYDN